MVLQECLWLVHNGVPFELAFGLDGSTRTGFAMIFAQFHGRKFNWDTMDFDDA